MTRESTVAMGLVMGPYGLAMAVAWWLLRDDLSRRRRTGLGLLALALFAATGAPWAPWWYSLGVIAGLGVAAVTILIPERFLRRLKRGG